MLIPDQSQPLSTADVLLRLPNKAMADMPRVSRILREEAQSTPGIGTYIAASAVTMLFWALFMVCVSLLPNQPGMHSEQAYLEAQQ